MEGEFMEEDEDHYMEECYGNFTNDQLLTNQVFTH